MLVLTRKVFDSETDTKDQSTIFIFVGDVKIQVKLLKTGQGSKRARIGLEGPDDVLFRRGELEEDEPSI